MPGKVPEPYTQTAHRPSSLAWASPYFKALTALAFTPKKKPEWYGEEWPGVQARKGWLVPACLATLPTVALSPSCPHPRLVTH